MNTPHTACENLSDDRHLVPEAAQFQFPNHDLLCVTAKRKNGWGRGEAEKWFFVASEVILLASKKVGQKAALLGTVSG